MLANLGVPLQFLFAGDHWQQQPMPQAPFMDRNCKQMKCNQRQQYPLIDFVVANSPVPT